MKTLLATLAVLGFSGCAPLAPVQLRSAPEPSEQEMAQLRNIQSRTIAIRRDAVFPRVLEVLMDGGYVIRSANTDLGLVTFYQQWMDQTQHNANIAEEGSAIFSSAGPNQTRVRLVISGSWQRLEVTGGGFKSPDSGMIGGVLQSASPEEYAKLMDLLERGLRSARP